jgi:hypothetical protein
MPEQQARRSGSDDRHLGAHALPPLGAMHARNGVLGRPEP